MAKYGKNRKTKEVSLFSGCGGLDRGFEKAGCEIVWANEYGKDIWATYKLNHKSTIFDTRSITDISENEVPDCDGIIGGLPCHSCRKFGALYLGIGSRLHLCGMVVARHQQAAWRVLLPVGRGGGTHGKGIGNEERKMFVKHGHIGIMCIFAPNMR